MLKSKIAPILVGIVLVAGAAIWIWVIMSIDYTPMKARTSPGAVTAVPEP